MLKLVDTYADIGIYLLRNGFLLSNNQDKSFLIYAGPFFIAP